MDKSKYMVPGECGANSARFILDHLGDGWTLVHGIVLGRGPIAGVRYFHAWVERTEKIPVPGFKPTKIKMAYDPTTGHRMPAALYYRVGQVSDAKRYSSKKMIQLMMKEKH